VAPTNTGNGMEWGDRMLPRVNVTTMVILNSGSGMDKEPCGTERQGMFGLANGSKTLWPRASSPRHKQGIASSRRTIRGQILTTASSGAHYNRR